jgi:hypothetical protein
MDEQVSTGPRSSGIYIKTASFFLSVSYHNNLKMESIFMFSFTVAV